MRFIVALIVGLIILDGASCTSSSRTMSAAEKKAIQTAKQWAIAQGLDPTSAEFSATADGAGWSILVEQKPATPGGHAVIMIDSNGKIADVLPGA